MDFDNSLPETEAHKPTVELILCAYPHGIPNVHYLTLLSILEKDMSIRALAGVIARIRGGHYSVYMNDVVEAKRFSPDEGVLNTVMDKLMSCGYTKWVQEIG
jgi:hypothetical protein